VEQQCRLGILGAVVPEEIMPQRKIIKGLFAYSEEFIISLILRYNCVGPKTLIHVWY
jgi:hypothetical protein